jgi:NAD(P)-dependent dehydrogenase (short-subunit alcohol dehydrogenase family)
MAAQMADPVAAPTAVLRGKIVWITGAGTGIGLAAAEAFAREGAQVALVGRRTGPLEDAARAVRKAGAEARIVALDVAHREQVEAAARDLLAAWPRVDVLVNNAGLNVPKRRLAELSGQDWDLVVGVNLTGAFNMIQAVLPPMRAQGTGLILNVSSIAGKVPSGLAGAAYTASKHGVVGLSHSINNEEWRHGIRATALCPGEVNTPIIDKRPVKLDSADKERMIQPEDLAETLMFLARLHPRTHVPEMTLMPTHRRPPKPGELG